MQDLLRSLRQTAVWILAIGISIIAIPLVAGLLANMGFWTTQALVLVASVAALTVFSLLRRVSERLDIQAGKIAGGLAEAERSKAELVVANAGVDAQLEAAQEAVLHRLAQAEQVATELVDEAKLRASEEGAKILAEARARAEQERVQVREALRDQVAALAVKGAEQILRRELSESEHQQLLNALNGSDAEPA